MALLLKNAHVIDPQVGLNETADILVRDGNIVEIGQNLTMEKGVERDLGGKIVVPGLVDIHVHLREPGYELKDPLPIYTQMEGDILFAQQDYAGALAAYEKVNASNIASPATFFSAAKTKELLKGDPKEVVALMDSCIARCPQPITADFAPYLLERAQMNMNADQARNAMLDYDAYHTAVKGEVNDVFYYYREQAALKARQFQRALDDIAKAIEMNPTDLTYQAEHAVINLRVGRYEEAILILNNILKTDPKYGEAYRLLGLCQIQLKKTDEACGNFKKAKELGDPNADELITKYCK